MKKRIAAVCAALLVAACSKPMDAVIPASKDEQAEFVEKVISKLSEDDKKLYASWLIRRGLASAFTNAPLVPPGTTVAQAITEQKEWLRQQEVAKAEEIRLTQEREAARQAAQQAIQQAAKIKFGGHELRPKNYQANRYSDQQVIYLEVGNLSEKVIHGIKAKLRYIDLFGETIFTVPFEVTDTISPQHGIHWAGTRDLNQFIEADKRLMNLDQNKYSTEITIQMIVFADGTRLESP